MDLNDRIKVVIQLLIGYKISENQEGIGKLLGYGNKSYFSQIINGKASIPDGFLKKLVGLDNRISEKWLLNNEGSIENKQVYSKDNSFLEQENAFLKEKNDTLKLQLRDKDKINTLQEEKIAKLEADIEALKSAQGTTVNQFNQPSQSKPLTQPLTQSTR